MLRDKRLGVIGAGNMGGALLNGVLRGSLIADTQILVSDLDPARRRDVEERLGVATTDDNGEVVRQSDVVLLAVKPQTMDKVLSEVSEYARPDQLFVTIAAGITTGHIETTLGVDVPVMRVMPNTPALVGEGASVYCRGAFATAEHALLVHAMLDAVGIAVEAVEELMDPVTAVSGTGPAYIFYTLEAMIRGACALGMDEHMAKLLVKQTVLGAARLVISSGEDPSDLRAKVTSKGGTTEAAISLLDERGYGDLVSDAIRAACDRAHELNSTFENTPSE
jgi:pyrroline-5-carboxylate reductase